MSDTEVVYVEVPDPPPTLRESESQTVSAANADSSPTDSEQPDSPS